MLVLGDTQHYENYRVLDTLDTSFTKITRRLDDVVNIFLVVKELSQCKNRIIYHI